MDAWPKYFEKFIVWSSIQTRHRSVCIQAEKQFDVYCSFKPNPGAVHVDALSISWSNLDFYCFPPFSPDSFVKDNARESNRSSSCPTVANTIMVSSIDANVMQTSSCVVSRTTPPKNYNIFRVATPLSQGNVSIYISVVRKQLEGHWYSPDTKSIILSSWRDGTKSQYQSSLNEWVSYCGVNGVDVLSPKISQALDFLSKLFGMNASYSTINIAKSELSL